MAGDDILKAVLDRIVADPDIDRDLKRVAVEVGGVLARGTSARIRTVRVLLAGALRELEGAFRRGTGFARGTLSGLLDTLAVAEETVADVSDRWAADLAERRYAGWGCRPSFHPADVYGTYEGA